jgi:hypothetical protein
VGGAFAAEDNMDDKMPRVERGQIVNAPPERSKDSRFADDGRVRVNEGTSIGGTIEKGGATGRDTK